MVTLAFVVVLIGCTSTSTSSVGQAANISNTTEPDVYIYDPNGYVVFCLCMGRFGNQADHLLGSMAFAKGLNRTFVVPAFRTYKNVPFKDWFKPEAISKYHRTIDIHDFMEHIAPKYWHKRTGFCWLPSNTPASECRMKDGNPFGPFWNELNVDFDSYEKYDLDYLNYDQWKKEFPAEKWPVLAFKGAPANFPILPEHRTYQKYLQWSDTIDRQAMTYINNTLKSQKFIGIHLRNGLDWQNACKHISGNRGINSFMASPQCQDNLKASFVTTAICLPTISSILEQLKTIVVQTGIQVIYIATDANTLQAEIEAFLTASNVSVYHQDPWLPIMDLAILTKSDYFVGNCVSSFTSFVKRARDINNMSSTFWGV
jgi:peptide-O-fucosyltransferase